MSTAGASSRPGRTGRTARGKVRPRACREGAANAESSTLRVSVEKVDQLINLVGELVITQAMLAQNGKGARRRRCTSSCSPGWPTWSATRATCRKR
jgi:two-component system chemotaxis sensor kinase CheA